LAHPVRSPVTLAELTAGLIWPTLLRIPAMAVQPGRLLLGAAVVVALALVARLFDGGCKVLDVADFAGPLFDSVAQGFAAFAEALFEVRPVAAVTLLYEGAIAEPIAMFRARPFSAAALLVLAVPVWTVGGGALSRMVAVDVAGHVNMSLGESLGFALRRAWTLSWALLLPLVAMALLALFMAVAGWLLLNLPVVEFVGAVLYGGFLLLGLLVTLIFVGFALGQALLVPAVATESTDSVDAFQRAYAYVLGRPARLATYGAAAVAIGVVVYAVAGAFIGGAERLTADLSMAWLSDARANELLGATGGEESFAATLIRWWTLALGLLLAGFGVSLYFSASTIVYMLCRRVNDEQDLREVWMPGLVEGTLVADKKAAAAGSDLED